MRDPGTLAVALLALVVAGLAAWAHRPRRPALDAERWFKLMLATLLRGEVEAEGGDAVAWGARVLRHVPYHPAGRQPERKIVAPSVHSLPGPALAGERALVEALAAESDRQERWARMYDRDERALQARLVDPAELGPDYAPDRWLGPGASWEDLARWGAGDGRPEAALDRSLQARWVLVEGVNGSEAGPLLRSLEQLLGEGRVGRQRGATGESLEEQVARLVGQLAEAAPEPADRLVLVGAAEGVQVILGALIQSPEARDRLVAALSIGGVWGGRLEAEGAWAPSAVRDRSAARFRHDRLDVEIARARPWLVLEWLDRGADPPGIEGLPLSHQRPPRPADEGGLDASVEAVELGVLPLRPDLPWRQVARALWAIVACWSALSRSGRAGSPAQRQTSP